MTEGTLILIIFKKHCILTRVFTYVFIATVTALNRIQHIRDKLLLELRCLRLTNCSNIMKKLTLIKTIYCFPRIFTYRLHLLLRSQHRNKYLRCNLKWKLFWIWCFCFVIAVISCTFRWPANKVLNHMHAYLSEEEPSNRRTSSYIFSEYNP